MFLNRLGAGADKLIFIFKEFNANQSAVVLGSLGISRINKDYYPLVVGNHILGRLPMASLLFLTIREKYALTYDATSYFVPLISKGPFLIKLQTTKDKTDFAKKAVKELLSNYIEHGPTEEELSSAKKYIIGSFRLRTFENSSLLRSLSSIAFYNLPKNSLNLFEKNIGSVTQNDVKSSFKKVIDPENLISIVVGKKDV